MPRYRPLDFFEVLRGLDTEFFNELEHLALQEAEDKALREAERKRRNENILKAARIYPRLKRVEAYNAFQHTGHIENDFFDELRGRVNRGRLRETRKLFLKRERIRMFLKALHDFWAFDIPIPWATPYMALRYSRHRKAITKLQRRFVRDARKRKHVSKIKARELKRERAEKAEQHLKALASDEGLRRLREEGWKFNEQCEIIEIEDPSDL